MSKNDNELLLEVENLKTYFDTDEGTVRAVDGVSFSIDKGETIGIVGESGCGKSITSLSIIQIVPAPGKIVNGKINYYKDDTNPINITDLKPKGPEMRSLRGAEIAMVFQEPMTAFNPVFTIGDQIMEGVLLHQNLSKEDARQRVIELLEMVGISAPEQRIDEYPHQFSGGMRQRAAIAMALSCDPSLLIADEPTTALDVTIEAQILELLKDLQSRLDMSIMLITHDLGVVGEMADRVVVMYAGKVVETASVDDIFHNPQHPYTKGLLKSLPVIGRRERLTPIKGTVPNLGNLPKGCYFAPRCEFATERCHNNEPGFYRFAEGHQVRCWRVKKEDNDG